MKTELPVRQDLDVISNIIPPKTRVLDLGCGDGSLFYRLKNEKHISGTGLEYDQSKILECIERGVPVIHEDLNNGLSQFRNNSFDYTILSQTLQSVKRPDLLLKDMVRVGKKAVISFINMGYYQIRLQLLIRGKMPETKTLPYHWYNTPNTHLSTINDFHDLCRMLNIEVIEKIPLNDKKNVAVNIWPNMFASTCVFTVAKQK